MVRLSSSLHERLTAASEKHGVTMSELMRKALEAALEQLEEDE